MSGGYDQARFVAARLAEDEAYANDPGQWNEYDPGDPGEPARVLRGVAARQAILDMYESQPGWDLGEGVSEGRDPDERERDEAVRDALGEVIAHLATEWSGHPDYRP